MKGLKKWHGKKALDFSKMLMESILYLIWQDSKPETNFRNYVIIKNFSIILTISFAFYFQSFSCYAIDINPQTAAESINQRKIKQGIKNPPKPTDEEIKEEMEKMGESNQPSETQSSQDAQNDKDPKSEEEAQNTIEEEKEEQRRAVIEELVNSGLTPAAAEAEWQRLQEIQQNGGGVPLEEGQLPEGFTGSGTDPDAMTPAVEGTSIQSPSSASQSLAGINEFGEPDPTGMMHIPSSNAVTSAPDPETVQPAPPDSVSPDFVGPDGTPYPEPARNAPDTGAMTPADQPAPNVNPPESEQGWLSSVWHRIVDPITSPDSVTHVPAEQLQGGASRPGTPETQSIFNTENAASNQPLTWTENVYNYITGNSTPTPTGNSSANNSSSPANENSGGWYSTLSEYAGNLYNSASNYIWGSETPVDAVSGTQPVPVPTPTAYNAPSISTPSSPSYSPPAEHSFSQPTTQNPSPSSPTSYTQTSPAPQVERTTYSAPSQAETSAPVQTTAAQSQAAAPAAQQSTSPIMVAPSPSYQSYQPSTTSAPALSSASATEPQPTTSTKQSATSAPIRSVNTWSPPVQQQSSVETEAKTVPENTARAGTLSSSANDAVTAVQERIPVVLPRPAQIQNPKNDALMSTSSVVTQDLNSSTRPSNESRFASLFSKDGEESSAQVRGMKRVTGSDFARVETVFSSTVRASDLGSFSVGDLFAMEKTGKSRGLAAVARKVSDFSQENFVSQGIGFVAQMCQKVASAKRQLVDAVFGDRQDDDGVCFEDVVSVWDKIRAGNEVPCWNDAGDLLEEYFSVPDENKGMNFSTVYASALSLIEQSAENF